MSTRATRPTKWSKREDERLRELFPHHSNGRIAEEFGRTPQAIGNRAARMGLKKSTARRQAAAKETHDKSRARRELLPLEPQRVIDPYAEDTEILDRIAQVSAENETHHDGDERCPNGCTGDPDGQRPLTPRNDCPVHALDGPDDPEACQGCRGFRVVHARIDQWGLCHVRACRRCTGWKPAHHTKRMTLEQVQQTTTHQYTPEQLENRARMQRVEFGGGDGER